MNKITFAVSTFLVMWIAQCGNAQFAPPNSNPSTNSNPSPNSQGTPKISAYISPTFYDPWSGLELESGGGFQAGLEIVKVDPAGLAMRNGLEIGDIILKVDQFTVSNQGDLSAAIAGIPPQLERIEIELINIRNGNVERHPFNLRTLCGNYQTNFGRLELAHKPMNPGHLTGQLFFYSGDVATVSAEMNLDHSGMNGSTRNSRYGVSNFRLSVVGGNKNCMEGIVTTQKGQVIPFSVFKRN
ncbi:PDZ domain-containing protein [bacterium]|nr:PDZ domain-containing protein [Mariniblastus sp.]MDB4396547.1 PDZ domain-containing protein [bacterium]